MRVEQVVASVPQQQQPPQEVETFNGKLTQIEEFPINQSSPFPYKILTTSIDRTIVDCINVRPDYFYYQSIVTLPEFVKRFCPQLTIEKAREILQDVLKINIYKGNSGHQEILQKEGKCSQFDPVPLVFVEDLLKYLPAIKEILYRLNAVVSAADSSSGNVFVS